MVRACRTRVWCMKACVWSPAPPHAPPEALFESQNFVKFPHFVII